MTKINQLGVINSLSYGYVNLNIAKALEACGHEVAFHLMGDTRRVEVPTADKDFLTKIIKRAETYDKDAPCLKVWQSDGLKDQIGRAKHVGFPFFELDRLQPHEIHILNSLDAVCVASHWAETVLRDGGVTTPIYVCPLGVDRDVFHENIELDNDIAKDAKNTKFLITGKWEVRKGHDVVLKAFERAFGPNDNVALIINCYNPFGSNDEWEKYYETSPLSERFLIIKNRLAGQENVAALMASVDCGIFISRAEGFNLPLLETMSCGKHVITTASTAHSEFADCQNAMLVNVGPMETAYDGVFFHGQGQWPSLDENSLEQAVEWLRKVHDMKQREGPQINKAGIETAKRFSWANTAKRLEAALEH